MKQCSKCGEEKSTDNFYRSSKHNDGFQSRCIDCHRAYRKQHYQDNKDKYIRKAKVWSTQNHDANRARLMEYLKDRACVDCGESDPVVLEFDHITDSKRDDIASMLNYCTWQTVIDEIAKCVVRCANCHRRKTAVQFGYWRVSA